MKVQIIALTDLEVQEAVATDHSILGNAIKEEVDRYHQWRANLRIREARPIRSVPYVPKSHPFTERLIGTIRREYLDEVLFWNGCDLEEKLGDFQDYYNAHRVHQSLNLKTPDESAGKDRPTRAELSNFIWRSHCTGQFQAPMAA